MAAAGVAGANPLPPPSTAPVDGDFIGLEYQLSSLRRRVKELERENQSLLSRLASCRCAKEEDASFHAKASASTAEIPCNEVGAVETMGLATALSSHHLVTSSSDPDKEEASPVGGLDREFKKRSGLHSKTMQHYVRRYIALKIMYFGLRFYGFASEAQMDPTVESEIFEALKRTRLLVGNKEDSHYSRCGRTDKGVSSTGQVISLYLRSKLKELKGNIEDEANLKDNCEEEIDYVKVMNKVLPRDIRVIGWSPVPTEFHARFSCLSREYRYLFWRGSLDLVTMQRAAKKFIGEYDFRNLCKMDAANVTNYTRRITSFEISYCNQRLDDDELWAMTVKGSAFLWHQVRCMVAVLFMIGQGLELPDVLDALLDTSKTKRKPQFSMAPELPLILRFCEFEDLSFICSPDARRALHEHLKSEYQSYMLQATIFYEALGCLSIPEEKLPELCKKKRCHVPLMLRPTEPSYEERRARLKTKVTQKFLSNCPQKQEVNQIS